MALARFFFSAFRPTSMKIVRSSMLLRPVGLHRSLGQTRMQPPSPYLQLQPQISRSPHLQLFGERTHVILFGVLAMYKTVNALLVKPRETMSFFSCGTLLLLTAFCSATCRWISALVLMHVAGFFLIVGQGRVMCPLKAHRKQVFSFFGSGGR